MKLKSKIKTGILAGLFVSTMVFVYVRTANKFYGQVVVQLENQDYSFIDKSDVIAMISERAGVNLNTIRLHEMSLRSIEKKVKSYNFVSDCEVARDLKGNLIVEIKQNHPIARILNQHSARAGGYLSEGGQLLPLSKSFTARVLLVSGSGTEQILNGHFLESKAGKTFINFLNYIDKNAFWKAQITQIEIDKKGRLKLLTQVGSQIVLFGEAENFEAKLKKLDIFYEKIIPNKGWNRYKTVNLEFENQIVCS